MILASTGLLHKLSIQYHMSVDGGLPTACHVVGVSPTVRSHPKIQLKGSLSIKGAVSIVVVLSKLGCSLP